MAKAATAFTNCRVHALDPRFEDATWFTVVSGRFQRVGAGPVPAGLCQVDLNGGIVVPGFVDAHAHFFQTGLDMTFVDLAGAASLAEVGRRLFAYRGGRRTWIFAHGYQEDSLKDAERLTRALLDDLCPERPVWINRVDYHSAVVNSVALRRLSLPADVDGYLRDERGQPCGILRSEAYFRAKQQVSALVPVEVRDRAVKTAAQACIRRGITSVHALEGGRLFGDEGVHSVMKRMHALPLDVTLFLQEKNVYLTERFGFEHLGGCILIDGSIGSYTAALDTGYADAPRERGTLYEKQRELAAFIEQAHAHGVQLAFHAIGPRAIQQLLDCYERALLRSPRHDHRHRIEHFEMATDEQIARTRDLGLVVSMQPSFELFWGGERGMYAKRIGERWRATNRLRRILDAGIVIAGGSDTNVTPADPLLGMHAAVNHPNPEQRVSPAEALRMMTLDAAYSAFEERDRGSISPGKRANFTVLAEDPLAVPAERIAEIRVEQTWHVGRCVYSRPDEAASGP